MLSNKPTNIILWNIKRGERTRYYVGAASLVLSICWGPANHLLVLPLQNIALPQPQDRHHENLSRKRRRLISGSARTNYPGPRQQQ